MENVAEIVSWSSLEDEKIFLQGTRRGQRHDATLSPHPSSADPCSSPPPHSLLGTVFAEIPYFGHVLHSDPLSRQSCGPTSVLEIAFAGQEWKGFKEGGTSELPWEEERLRLPSASPSSQHLSEDQL